MHIFDPTNQNFRTVQFAVAARAVGGVMTCSRSSLRAKRRFWFRTEDPIQVPAPGIARKTAPTELVNPTSRKTSTSPGTARWWQGKCNRGRGQSLQRYESSKQTSLSGASEASLEWKRKSCRRVWQQDNKIQQENRRCMGWPRLRTFPRTGLRPIPIRITKRAWPPFSQLRVRAHRSQGARARA